MAPKKKKKLLELIPRPGAVPVPKVGTYAFVDYGVAEEPWHERFVVKVVKDHKCVCITPDELVLEENLNVPPRRQKVAPHKKTLSGPIPVDTNCLEM